MESRAREPDDAFQHIDIVREVCRNRGWEMSAIDDFSELVAEISDGTKSFLWRSGCYPLNPALSAKIARDKAHTYQLLSAKGFKIPEGGHFFVVPEHSELRPGGRELDDAFPFAEKLGYPVFVKPMTGAFGRDAGVARNPSELAHRLVLIGRSTYAAMIQKIVTGTEHRIFVLDDEIGFSYRKRAAEIVGDGCRTIASLVEEPGSDPARVWDPGSPTVIRSLASRGLNPSSILPCGERLQVSENANPNSGAIIDDFRTEVPDRVGEWAVRVARSLELRIAGIDFFAPQSIAGDPDEFTVLEINADPALKTVWGEGHHDRVRQIWETILLKRFDEL